VLLLTINVSAFSTDDVLERKEGDLALKVLEKVGGYIKPDPGVTPGDKEACERLTPEYYVLRTALVSIIRSLTNSTNARVGVAS
jgi:hypothetical protein